MVDYDPSSPQLQARWLEAVAIVQARRLTDSPLKRQMMDIADRYNADFTIPLPDVEGEPEFPALSAAIISDAIDSFATRSNDTLPSITAPPVNPQAESHRKRAALRRRAWAANWYESQLPLRMARAYRQLMGYGTFSMLVVPDHSLHRARIVTRDPLSAYPEPMAPDEIRAPRNIGFVYGRSASFLIQQYPECAELLRKHTRDDADLWDVLEWRDADNIFIGIMGKREPEEWGRRYKPDGSYIYTQAGAGPMDMALLLRAAPNRAGMVAGVCPTAVTLDRTISSIKRIVPIVDLMNKVAALDFMASERGVFPDRYVLGANGQTPIIVGGHWSDGRTGQVNLLENVQTVGDLQTTPGSATQALLSSLERNARLSVGSPSLFSGEMSGSVRSGQTLTQLGSFAVDPRIKEAHEIMGYALTVVNEAVAAVELGYWPQRKYVVFSGWPGDMSHVEYTPSDIFSEPHASVVAYPMPGMDVQNATIALAQLNGAKMISRKTARARHPLVDDGDSEEQQLLEETIQDAVEMAALQLVGSGSMAFTDLIRIKELVRSGKSLEEAVSEAQREAQERQASQPEAPSGEVAPETMPGLNQPGAGGEAGLGAPAPTGSPSMGGEFAQLMSALTSAPGGPGGGGTTGAPAPGGAPA